MKKVIRNTIIILFYLTGVPYLRFLWLRKKYGALIRVIVFHEIKDSEVKAFKNKLKFLKKNFNVISPEQFYNQEFSKKKLNILLTFDDGYKSWLGNVTPVLKKENLSAIFFVDKRGFDLIPKLFQAGFEIGGHTLNHLRLPGLSTEELKRELRKGREVKFFAYPFGDKKSFNSKAIEGVKKAGYEYAFTILPGFNVCEKRNYKCAHANNFLMFRDSLNPTMPNILFKAWIYGSYDFIKRFLNIPYRHIKINY